MGISYHTTTQIWLSLENYYNNGISSKKAKEIIESIINPFQYYGYSSGDTLRCSPTYINGNWIVNCNTHNPDKIQHIVNLIQYRLDLELSISNIDIKTMKASK